VVFLDISEDILTRLSQHSAPPPGSKGQYWAFRKFAE